MPDRPRVWLSDTIRPGAKVTFVTVRWGTARHPTNSSPWVSHVLSYYGAEPGAPFPYCNSRLLLAEPRPDLPVCRNCAVKLARHGVWPL